MKFFVFCSLKQPEHLLRLTRDALTVPAVGYNVNKVDQFK